MSVSGTAPGSSVFRYVSYGSGMTSEPAGGADDADNTNIELTKVEVVGHSSLRSSNAANSSGSLAKMLMSLVVVSLFGVVGWLDMASQT